MRSFAFLSRLWHRKAMLVCKRFVAVVTWSVLLSLSNFINPLHSLAATKSPVPKKSSTKSPSAASNSTSTATAKPKPKPKPRKKVKLKPREDAWPPKGFENKGDVFAKIPSAREVLDAASRDKDLRKLLNTKVCEKYSCGAVSVASLNGCIWWEVTGDVIGPKSATDKSDIKLGSIRTLYGATTSQEIKTILLVSEHPRQAQIQVKNINTLCHMDQATEKIPSSTYKAF